MRRGHMTPNERRQIELVLLCQRRHDTCEHLADELGVSRATICDDMTILMCSYPIETVRGRHKGGIYVADNFYLHHKTLNEKQIAWLMKMREEATAADLDIVNSILFQFTL